MNNAHICIDDSRHLPPGVRFLEAVSTTVLWLAYLGLPSYVQSVVMDTDALTVARVYNFQWRPSQAGGLGFDSFIAHLLGVTLCGSSVLFLWAGYNRLRFRGRERRNDPATVSDQQFAQYFGATREQIATLQRARRLVMHHDANGRLTRVRCRTGVTVEASQRH